MTQLQQKNVPGQSIYEELQAAKNVALSFNAAFKYYSLYPAGHSFSSNYLTRFKSDLDEFLAEHKNLRLDISRNSFFYKGETLFVGRPEETNPAYLLSRDNILFLAFTKNIEAAEISNLLDIFKRHRNPLEDVDGDIATTLWHQNFAHIHYEAADIFAMEAIQFDLSMFKVAPGQRSSGEYPDVNGTTGQNRYGQTEGGTGVPGANQSGHGRIQVDASSNGHAHYSQDGGGIAGAASSLLLLQTNRNLTELDPEEQRWLDGLILHEESRDFTTDVIDILLITLAVESNELDFAAILEFLEFEFFDAMVKEDFSIGLKICKNVFNISEVIKVKKPWTITLVNLFFEALSREERFVEMSWLANYSEVASNPKKNLGLLEILNFLPVEITPVLGMLAAQVPGDNIHLRHKIIDSIAAKAKKDPRPLCSLVEGAGEETILLLLPVVEQLENDYAAQVYMRMIHHPSSAIRKIGMDGFFQTNKHPKTDEIVHLLQDPDKQLRERMLSYVEQLNTLLREDLLLSFLGQDSSTVEDDMYIMHCYRLLSGCLSSGSVEFLRHVLLESNLKSMFNNTRKAHKTGAVYVLRTLGTKEAMQILEKGAESMRPDIRQICKKALEI